jgi:hypothetical protein
VVDRHRERRVEVWEGDLQIGISREKGEWKYIREGDRQIGISGEIEEWK